LIVINCDWTESNLRSCDTNEVGAICFVLKTIRDLLNDLGLYGKTILKWILRKWNGGVDWMDLAQDRDKWRDVSRIFFMLEKRTTFYRKCT
jgi:hypothetical protein